MGPDNPSLIRQTDQQAILDEVLFYRDDCSKLESQHNFIRASIQLERSPASDNKDSLKNGWLITDFTSKEYDLGKESDDFQPMYFKDYKQAQPETHNNLPASPLKDKTMQPKAKQVSKKNK
jgi:hypothetical protein